MSAIKPERPRVALVTGGGRGIGLAVAQAFAREGYNVIITGRDEKRLLATARELEKDRKADVRAVACDVREPSSVESLFAEIRKHHSSLDVLVNNAGVAHALATVEKLPIEIWKQVIDTNLTGMFLMTRAALPLMQAGSTIVNNLSISAVKTFEGMAAYNASKSGALGFTNVLRQELRKKGIRVLALLPGPTDTEIWEQFWPEAPREKMVSPETIAQAILLAVTAPTGAAVEEIKIGPTVGTL